MQRAFLAAVALMAVVNVAVNQWLPGWLYIPVMAGAGLAVLAIARGAGITSPDLGLSPATARRSAAVGLAIGALAAAIIVAGALVPGLRDLYLDERTAGIGVGGLLYQTLLRIPLGTAVGEELMFRAGLLGIALRLWPRTTAIATTSLLFGVWHVLPTLSAIEGNASVAGRSAALVVLGAVVATALAGALLAWLLLRTRNVAAPTAVHATINATAFAAAYLVAT